MATTARTTARRVALGAGVLSIAATGGFAVVAAQTAGTGVSAADGSVTTSTTTRGATGQDSTGQDSTSQDSSGSSSSGLQPGDASSRGDASSNAS